MDEDRIAGSAQQIKGSAKEAAGNFVGDATLQAEGAAERAAGTVREAAGSLKDAARGSEESPQAEVRHLREEVDEIAAETAAANAKVEGYVRQADAVMNRQTDAVASAIRDYPLVALGGAAIAGYLLGRLTSGTTYIYRR